MLSQHERFQRRNVRRTLARARFATVDTQILFFALQKARPRSHPYVTSVGTHSYLLLNSSCSGAAGECLQLLSSGSSARLEELGTEAELSKYFAHGYLQGEVFSSSQYRRAHLDQIGTWEYDAPDGPVQIWCHAFDLRSWGQRPDDVIVLYHYTNQLCFQNVGDLHQTESQLFASLTDSRAHFGKGVYASQHEPAAAWLMLDSLRSVTCKTNPPAP